MPDNLALTFRYQRYGQGACVSQGCDDKLLCLICMGSAGEGRDNHGFNTRGLSVALIPDVYHSQLMQKLHILTFPRFALPLSAKRNYTATVAHVC